MPRFPIAHDGSDLFCILCDIDNLNSQQLRVHMLEAHSLDIVNFENVFLLPKYV